MVFDIGNIQGLSKQIGSAYREAEKASRLQRAVVEASRPSILGGIMQDIAKPPKIPSIGSYQNLAGAGLAQHHRSMQTSFGMASSLRTVPKFQDITRSMTSHRIGALQNTTLKFATPKLKGMDGLGYSALGAKIQSFNKMSDLTRGLAQPYKFREGGFMSALGGVTAALDQVNRLNASSAIGGFQSIQKWRSPLFGGQVARAISEATRVSSGWKPLLDDLGNYSLRDVRVMPVPHEITPTNYYLAPEISAPDSTLEAPPATTDQADQFDEMLDTSDEVVTYQFGGKWRILQPLENTVYRVMNGPLIVRFLFMDTKSIVIGVIIGGTLVLLFYSS